MYLSLEFDYYTIGIVTLALLSAFFVGWWISKHFSRVVTSVKEQNTEWLPDEQPKVSVIIYSCHGLDMLKETLPSMVSQDYNNFEIVVVDDNYDASTKDFLSELMLEHKNLYFTNIPQGTINLSRKKLALTLGIKAAHGEYVLLTESNCKAQSPRWLALMMGKCQPGIDLVIGNTGHIDKKWYSLARTYYDYDQVTAKVRYLSYALNGSPYRADSCNMVIRRKLFFDIKGFSSTLNLHAGEDDLFVKQIANSHNTKVQIAKDAQLQTYGTSTIRELRTYKLQHIFTEKYLHTFSKFSGALYLWIYWVLLISLAALLFLQPMNGAVWIFTVLVLLSVWGVQIFAFDRAATVLEYKPLRLRIPFFTMVAPGVNIWFRIIGHINRKSNFTYQRRRQK